jgi:hypothetical protein
VAHVQRQQARPDNFVNQGRGAGHREEDQERAAPHHGESIKGGTNEGRIREIPNPPKVIF